MDTHPVTPIADETAIWGDKHTPDLLGLASAVQTAQAAVRLQGDEALFEALSAGEIQSAQDYARRLRADQREHAYQARKALLDDEAARREHEQGMTKRERDDEAATQVARYSYKRLTSPTGDLARLNTARLWVPMLALLPAVFAVILGAANVGVELNRISAGTAWINWVVSPIFTVPVFAILVAQLAGFTITAPAPTVPFHRAPFTWLKVGLLAVEVVLNVAPHYLGTGATGTAGALVFGLVPWGWRCRWWPRRSCAPTSPTGSSPPPRRHGDSRPPRTGRTPLPRLLTCMGRTHTPPPETTATKPPAKPRTGSSRSPSARPPTTTARRSGPR
ncbi:hypothetical protein ACFQ0O_03835 [Saccharopolyspora spinosporotrichia]